MSRIAGGWEGRDTATYLGKERRRTSGERKCVEIAFRRPVDPPAYAL
jgi:hypothetical protein